MPYSFSSPPKNSYSPGPTVTGSFSGQVSQTALVDLESATENYVVTFPSNPSNGDTFGYVITAQHSVGGSGSVFPLRPYYCAEPANGTIINGEPCYATGSGNKWSLWVTGEMLAFVYFSGSWHVTTDGRIAERIELGMTGMTAVSGFTERVLFNEWLRSPYPNIGAFSCGDHNSGTFDVTFNLQTGPSFTITLDWDSTEAETQAAVDAAAAIAVPDYVAGDIVVAGDCGSAFEEVTFTCSGMSVWGGHDDPVLDFSNLSGGSSDPEAYVYDTGAYPNYPRDFGIFNPAFTNKEIEPKRGGVYRYCAKVSWQSNSTGERYAELIVSSPFTTIIGADRRLASTTSNQSLHGLMDTYTPRGSVGFIFRVFQNSGSNLTVDVTLRMEEVL